MNMAVPGPCDESVALPEADKGCANQTGVLAATILGSSLAFVVGSIVNVALPSIQATFGADAAGVQWIINAYLLPVGALVLLGGALGDHYGRKRMFLVGLVIFTVSTAAAAAAPNLEFLLAARAAEGVGAALVAPNSLAIIAAGFTGASRGKAIGTWAAAGAMAGAVAPVLGGWLVDVASWRWAFAVVVPLAVAGFWIGQRSITESREAAGKAAPLDWTGAVLATGTLGALTWALVALPRAGLADPAVGAALAAGVAGALAFVVIEYRKGTAAMMPLGLFSTASFTGVSLLTLFLYAALGGLLVLLPFTLIDAFGFSATAAGGAMLPVPVILGLLSRAAGGLAERIGARRMLTVGPLAVAVGFALMARVPATDFNYWWHLLPALLVIALGMATSVAPLTTAVMNSVADDHAGIASGVNNALARSAGLIATALLGVVLIKGVGNPAVLVAGFTGASLVGAGLAAVSAIAGGLLIRPPRVARQS